MKDYLFCRIGNCTFKVGVALDASEAECEEVINKFKRHLRSHKLDDLVDAYFNLMMMLREGKGAP